MPEIHIDDQGLEALRAFGDNQFPVVDIQAVANETINASALPPPRGPFPAADAFQQKAGEAGEKNKEFLTKVEQGFQAFKDGATKMAESYSAADQAMSRNMAEATTRDPRQPAISPKFAGLTG